MLLHINSTGSRRLIARSACISTPPTASFSLNGAWPTMTSTSCRLASASNQFAALPLRAVDDLIKQLKWAPRQQIRHLPAGRQDKCKRLLCYGMQQTCRRSRNRDSTPEKLPACKSILRRQRMYLDTRCTCVWLICCQLPNMRRV